jgi:hypothetical protein
MSGPPETPAPEEETMRIHEVVKGAIRGRPDLLRADLTVHTTMFEYLRRRGQARIAGIPAFPSQYCPENEVSFVVFGPLYEGGAAVLTLSRYEITPAWLQEISDEIQRGSSAYLT